MFTVQYFSHFYNEWREYIAPTFNAKPVRCANYQTANKAMEVLREVHPRDMFRIAEITA